MKTKSSADPHICPCPSMPGAVYTSSICMIHIQRKKKCIVNMCSYLRSKHIKYLNKLIKCSVPSYSGLRWYSKHREWERQGEQRKQYGLCDSCKSKAIIISHWASLPLFPAVMCCPLNVLSHCTALLSSHYSTLDHFIYLLVALYCTP